MLRRFAAVSGFCFVLVVNLLLRRCLGVMFAVVILVLPWFFVEVDSDTD
jgi:hypothetical protein